jgi:hypothetical protein
MFNIGAIELVLVFGMLGFALALVTVVVVLSAKRSGGPSTDNPNLRPCPDCGRSISVRAAMCPHCGAPVRPIFNAKPS